MPIELILELVIDSTFVKKGRPNRIWVEMGHHDKRMPILTHVYEIHADIPKIGRYKASRIKIPIDGKTWAERFYHGFSTSERQSCMAEFAVNVILQKLPRNIIFKKKFMIVGAGETTFRAQF